RTLQVRAGRLHPAHEVAAADDDADLDAAADQLGDLVGDRAGALRVQPGAGLAAERLAAELQQNPAIARHGVSAGPDDKGRSRWTGPAELLILPLRTGAAIRTLRRS